MGLDEGDHRSLALWAADCAEHVLPHFEEMCPDDDRPRKAVEAGRAAARAAARAAGHAAATAHVAGHADHAAAYAVTAATRAAGPEAASAAAAKERDWQYRHLPKPLRPLVPRAGGTTGHRPI